ncbi:hypothetical protein SO802_013472 [Lithocarpus litseifolius]|uniref:Uncharacterized protein n=1 Tax=Lithocarpus litseifolius TaxID=425828 RepID=A0AAW2D9T0_9ROSI
MIPPFQTLIQLLYYTTAGEEIRHANVRVVGWRAALLQRGEQAIDKERGIREVRSDAHIISNDPAQAQPIKGVLYHLIIGDRYLPFMLVLGVHARIGNDGLELDPLSFKFSNYMECWNTICIL